MANRGTAEAADNGNMIIGQTNLSTIQTTLARTAGGGGISFYCLDNTGTAASFGIRGEASGPGVGVFGKSDTGIGIQGASNSGPGAFLDSTSSVGFQGRSGTGIGVVGSTNGNVVLSQGQAPLTAFAAQFVGGHGVFIDGDLQVTGQKSAVVPHKDGSLRRVYCMESTETYFEDFGEADLVGGSATVRIDDDFSSIVRTNRYHVFITAYGDSGHLYVTNRTPRGFDVREHGTTRTNLRFAYRIVAPRGDVPEVRLERSAKPEAPKGPPPPVVNDETRRRVLNGR